MIKFLTLLTLLIGVSANATPIKGEQPVGSVSSLTASSVTISNLPANSVVYTRAGGALTANATTFAVTPAGNIGIGTTAPDSILHVKGAGNSFSKFEGGTNTGFTFANGGGVRSYMYWNDTAAGVTFGNNAATALMTILQGGNVGIGTTAPATTLDVNGSAQFGSTGKSTFTTTGALDMAVGASVSVFSNNGQGFLLKANNQSNHLISQIVQDGSNDSSYFDLYAASALKIRLWSSGKSYINNGQNFGIGATDPLTALHVIGAISQNNVVSCTLGLTTNSTGTISGCVASDVRLKTSIKSLGSMFGTIDALRPVTYFWKDEARGPGEKMGFIAQEVEKVYPDAVVQAGSGGLKGVDPNALIAVLVSEVQSLRKRVSLLEKQK
jgi:hypothetical protein